MNEIHSPWRDSGWEIHVPTLLRWRGSCAAATCPHALTTYLSSRACDHENEKHRYTPALARRIQSDKITFLRCKVYENSGKRI